jgi:hypothetical protein
MNLNFNKDFNNFYKINKIFCNLFQKLTLKLRFLLADNSNNFIK